MKILVTGATGLLGRELVPALLDRGYRVFAAYHERPPSGPGEWVRLDLEGDVASAVSSIRPDVIIHAAAYTDVDGCELDKERAYRLNYLATAAVARAASRVGARLIYISTDYVFDGSKGMYKESDAPSPINYYGLTKLLGEAAALSIGGLAVRVSGLFGLGKRNFGLAALERLARGEAVNAFVDQFLSPTYVAPLARALARLAELDVSGVLHLAGERASRYQMALLLAEAVGADKALVAPARLADAKLPAPRPRDSSLDSSTAASLGLALPPLRQMVEEFVAAFKQQR